MPPGFRSLPHQGGVEEVFLVCVSWEVCWFCCCDGVLFCFILWCCFGLHVGKISILEHPLPCGPHAGIPVFPGIPKQQRLNLPGLVQCHRKPDPHLCFAAEVAQPKIYQTKFPVIVSFWLPGI